ncbi:MAG: carboxypeptidase regulatory-like domain-containing protein [Acidobacteria bacterium]|nr:carboxypeptidase regulatory-like domain-containing protein [Acidobacteriota bacterium]
MMRTLAQVLWMALLTTFAAGTASAGTVTGVVRNATTGAPAAGVEVVLLQLQGGMETVANTKTDAQGRYHLEHSGIGRQPMLVRVSYRGVNFHQSLPPGRDTADLEVFEPTADARAVQVASRLIFLQPNGPTLLIGEEFTVQNNVKPPAAYYKAGGNFEFQLPEGGELAQVSAWGSSAMPVVQGTIDRGPRRYAIAFAFRPGESGVRISYQVPYATNQAVLRLSSPYAAGRVLVVAPPTMQVSGTSFQPAGTEQGWNVYAREAVPAGTMFDLSVFGTAPPPSASGQQSEQEQQNRDSGRATQVLPSRLDSLQWPLIGGFAALFGLGAFALWRKPAVVPSRAAPANAPKPRRVEKKPAQGTAAGSAAGVAQAAAELDRSVSQSLDELKDTLFRLELRRQAGSISEEEYARERERAEKVLRDLVRG